MSTQLNEIGTKKDKVLLMLLPFWTPLIPPLGISCLKGYLKQQGYDVTIYDANINLEFSETINDYNGTLKQIVPEQKQGNFYNTAHKVLRNHSMAYINRTDETKYHELVKIIIEKHYFCEITMDKIRALDEILQTYYRKLENCVLGLITKYMPAVVGISVFTGTLPASVYAFKLIKEKYPQIKTVMGGGIFADQLAVNSPNFKRFVEKTPYIDQIIIGEGESLIIQYLENRLPVSGKVVTLQDNQEGLLDLSNAVLPDYSDLELQAYPELAAYVSRSCPFQCSFCSETVQWGKFRQKNTANIVEELVQLSHKHKFQLFLLGDSLLNPFISNLADEIIRRDLSIYWDGYLRADKLVTLENALRWRKGGFYRARLGVESGSQNVLNLMDKRITPDIIRSSISNLAAAGIKTTAYWVVGHPGETEADFQQTLDIIADLKDDIYEAECNVFQYFANAQVSSDKWSQNFGTSLLYPEEMTDMLLTQTWLVNTEPTREVIYDRMRRFVEHCKKLGIPNPYTLRDLYLADERWKKLHSRAVPLITDFKNKKIYITENTKIVIDGNR